MYCANGTPRWVNLASTTLTTCHRTTALSPLPKNQSIFTCVSTEIDLKVCAKLIRVLLSLLCGYLALLACFLFFVVLAIVWILLEIGYKRGIFDGCFKRLKLNKLVAKKDIENGQGGTGDGQTGEKIIEKKKSTRLKSLDTFRGYKMREIYIVSCNFVIMNNCELFDIILFQNKHHRHDFCQRRWWWLLFLRSRCVEWSPSSRSRFPLVHVDYGRMVCLISHNTILIKFYL